MATRDPRESITPESFAIDPNLLGLPLARPMRRAGAMAIDLLLIALLVNAGGVLFGFAAAWVFFRISAKSARTGFLGRSWRFAFRSIGALVLFAVVASLWGSWRRDPAPAAPTASDAPAGVEGFAVTGDLGALRTATNEDARADAAERVAVRPPPAASASVDSLLESYAVAVVANDSAARATLRPQIAEGIVADTVAALAGEVRRLQRENASIRSDLRDAREERGILSFLSVAADDLGLSLGWMGLYFTAFLVLWRGQTPGKRLLRIRVVRLDGKPMTWWASFERFGGYAASVVTGLLGFFQIIWDRNRQGMHDKITETVVIRL